ncbi:MAG: anthranilate phosphoribosyltransferase [Pseudomonadota bacterium]
MNDAFKPLLAQAVSGAPLDGAEMTAAMEMLLAGDVSDIQAAAFLTALRVRGETIDEISAAAKVMRAKALRVDAPEYAIDTCGTGGAGKGNLNVSTAAALVAAGCGVPIAKHGNKAVSSKSGAADVLERLGVNLHASPAQISRSIEKANIGFMFARLHHQAVANVAAVRAGLGVRTIFNLLGPLSNPAGAKRQVMGVFDKALIRPLAEALMNLGAERAWVVHGADGLDELTTTTHSYVSEIRNGAVRDFTVSPEGAGLPLAREEDLKGGDPAFNANAIGALLDGEQGPFRDIVVLNAAAAVIVAGRAETLREAAAIAQKSIDDGAAKTALAALIRYSNAEQINTAP